MLRAGLDNATVLMLQSAQYIIILGRKGEPVSVKVPVNPAHYLHVYLLNEDTLDGATEEVYKFRTQFHENLLILYANNGDKLVTLTIGEIIAEANMCSLGTKVK